MTRTETSTPEAGKLKVRYKVHLAMRNRRSRLLDGPAPEPVAADPVGVVPRISRLLALAHHVQGLIDAGHVRDLAEVARLGRVTRARMTQIMNLLLLTPDIQEDILFLPLTVKGKDSITLRGISRICAQTAFSRQRQRLL